MTKFIGAYVTAEPTLEDAPRQAALIGASAFGFVTAPTNVWTIPDPDEAVCNAFRENCRQYGYTPAQILPHAGFMINPGSPDARKLRLSRQALVDDFRRCKLLGLTMINFHPGSTLNQISEEDCLKRIAESIMIALDAVPGVDAVIENTAGQGSALGWRLEHLAEIIRLTDYSPRVGVCIDTCHAQAAGYDLADKEGYHRFWHSFDSVVGADRLRGMHLNDAQRVAGSRVDRHASIGAGTVGAQFFQRLLSDPISDNIPLLLETPDESLWPAEIYTLYGYSLPNNLANI